MESGKKQGEAPSSPGAERSEDPEEAAARRLAEERRRIKAARREAEFLYRYGLALPAADAEVFNFIVSKLNWASELGLGRPENLEGLFFNRLFFAAGRWGAKPEFARSWVYLFRAIGFDLGPTREQAVVSLIEKIYRQGMEETTAIETAVFGAPLEGGDPAYWIARGFPSLDLSAEAWALRNDLSLDLYAEFLDGLDTILSPAEKEAFQDFLHLFNLES